MGLTPEHLRASYEIYMKHGNSSSAAVFAVINRLLKMGEVKQYITSCAFGPGIAIEMMMFKSMQTSRSGTVSPTTADSDNESRSAPSDAQSLDEPADG